VSSAIIGLSSLGGELLAVEVPYWGQSLLRVLGGTVAVLLPAGTIVYVFLSSTSFCSR